MTSIAINLEVNDNGSVVVDRFTDKTVSKVRQMSRRSSVYIKRMAARFSKGLGGAVVGVGRSLLSLKALATGALAGWGLTRIMGRFADFESALVDMGKVTTESFTSIKKKIMDLPAELGSATELVRGYYQVISAGVKGAAKQLDTLVTASKLAKTAHADQAQVITGLSSVMDAFKTSSTGAADSLQTMEKTGKTTVGNLIPIIGEISSSSAALGISLDEMGAAFAAVTLQSGGTRKAATQYKALMTSLIAPTVKMEDLLSKYGGAQQAIKKIGFGGVLRIIQKATRGNATETKELLGSTEGYLGFLSASANQMLAYNQNLEEQKNKTGAVDKAWKKYEKTLTAIWDTFKNTIGKQVIFIGEELAPAIKRTISATSSWLKKNRELIALKMGSWIQQVGKTALNTIAYIVEAIPSISTAFAAVGSAVSHVTTGVITLGATAVDVAGVIAAMRSPASIATAMTKGLRAATPGLARARDTLDEMGVRVADAALKFDSMGSSAAGNADKAQQMADKIRSFSRELIIAADQQIKTTQEEKQVLDSTAQAAQQSAQKMAVVWKDEIVKIDGVWTNLKKKVMVPVESTLQVQDKATPALEKVEAQSKKTSQVMEKKATVSINDQATSTLKQIQREMAKIKDKTVTVKVVHTGTGSTELPLTEKVNEILGMYEQMPSSMAMNMDMTQVTAGFDTLLEISSQLASAQRSVGFNRQIAWTAGLPYKTTSADYEANRLETLYNTLLSSMSAPAGSQVSGSTTSVSVDQLNINVPNALPQTAEDWRMIVREHVIPELERVGHA